MSACCSSSAPPTISISPRCSSAASTCSWSARAPRSSFLESPISLAAPRAAAGRAQPAPVPGQPLSPRLRLRRQRLRLQLLPRAAARRARPRCSCRTSTPRPTTSSPARSMPSGWASACCSARASSTRWRERLEVMLDPDERAAMRRRMARLDRTQRCRRCRTDRRRSRLHRARRPRELSLAVERGARSGALAEALQRQVLELAVADADRALGEAAGLGRLKLITSRRTSSSGTPPRRSRCRCWLATKMASLNTRAPLPRGSTRTTSRASSCSRRSRP